MVNKNFLEYLDEQPKTLLMVCALGLLLLLGIIDYLTREALAVSVFYSIPISLVAWFVGRGWGILVSLLSAMAWVGTDLMLGYNPHHAPVLSWNATAGLGYFLIVTYALSALKKAWEREKELSRMDSLTGIANGKYFYELAHTEIYRSRRYGRPFTLAYLDVDNFKRVNDESGHATGDGLLRLVAATLRNNLRLSDVVGRLGGDEFGILLPETGWEQAETVMNGLQRTLLDTLQKNGWPVTFSIGVITCQNLECTVDEMIRMADALMYSAKNSGKNMIKYDKRIGE
jgi:diguanylate cyclase (GGDEF)-like protein